MFHDNNEKELQSTEEEDGSGCLAGNIETVFLVSVFEVEAVLISYSVLLTVEDSTEQ